MPLPGLGKSLSLPELSPLSFLLHGPARLFSTPGPLHMSYPLLVHTTHLPSLVPCHHSGLPLAKCKFQLSPHFSFIISCLFSSCMLSPSVIFICLFIAYLIVVSLLFLTLNSMRTGSYICVIPLHVPGIWESLVPGKRPQNFVTWISASCEPGLALNAGRPKFNRTNIVSVHMGRVDFAHLSWWPMICVMGRLTA